MIDRITRADIVDASLGLLAEGGLPALAMRRIAATLGVQQSALYWHFDSKQRLLAAVADRIVAAIDDIDVENAGTDDGGTAADRRMDVTTLTARLRTELLRYRDGAELVASAIAFRLGGALPARRLTEALLRAGVDADDAEAAASVLMHFTLGHTTDEQQYRQAAALGAVETDADVAESFDDTFVRGLRLIVSGIERS